MTYLPFNEAKEYIEKEIALYQAKFKNKDYNKFEIGEDKGKTTIRFECQKDANLFNILQNFVKNVNGMEVEKGFVESSIILKGKDKLFFILDRGKKIVDYMKIGDLNTDEIEAIIESYKLGNKIKESENPLEKLAGLGAVIYTANEFDWNYLAGYEQVKLDIKNTIILPLKHQEVYTQIIQATRKVPESNMAKAVLFDGEPGTGKTTAARIIAKEANLPLVYVPLESIVSKWYGESEKNLASIFKSCRETKCIAFLDEIDALATTRDGEMHEASRRVLSVLLREIDGFVQHDNTLLISATNRKKDLDDALLSRFGLTITFPLPNEMERGAIFENYAKHLTKDQLNDLGKKTQGLSGRDIKWLCSYAERNWAAKVITEQLQVTPPPYDEYFNSLKIKIDKGPKKLNSIGFKK